MEKKQVKHEMELSIQQLEQQGLILPKNITDTVLNTLTVYENQGNVSFPPNYSVGNALKAAYLIRTIQNYRNAQMHLLLMLY